MKVSLFGYNRKETDNYFNYLNENNASQAEQIELLKAKLAEAEKAVDEYKRIDEINKQEKDELQQQIEELKADCDDRQKEVEDLEKDRDERQQQINDLEKKLEEKPSSLPDNDRLGFIFAVAYRDMENKNKAVSARIREYADMMFNRMNDYRNEVASIVNSVTEMQNRQKEELARLCEEASEKLDMLTAVSENTLDDMKKIEESRGNICGEIDNMICETINTDSYTLIQSPAADDDENTGETEE